MSTLKMAKIFSGLGIYVVRKPGIQINTAYRGKLLLLPAIQSITNEVYVCHQDNALAHCARQTAKQWSCFLMRNPNSHVAAQQPRP